MLLERVLYPDRPIKGEPSIHDLRRSTFQPQRADGVQAGDPVTDGGDQAIHELDGTFSRRRIGHGARTSAIGRQTETPVRLGGEAHQASATGRERPRAG